MVNVNDVYQTVLLILNKEQRGYLTPEEFNRIGSQVQLEIYNKTFEDYNQLIRQPQPDTGTADRVQDLEVKLAPFRSSSVGISPSQPTNSKYGIVNLPSNLYRLDRIVANFNKPNETEMQPVTFSELFNLNSSLLTTPTEDFPIFAFESNSGNPTNFTKIAVLPKSLAAAAANFKIFYFVNPPNIVWDFTIGGDGEYLHSSTTSTQFTLVNSEFTAVVLKVLLYAGVVIRDPQIVQTAASKVQKEEIQEKS